MTTMQSEMAPAVRSEACAGYRADPECPCRTCAHCGWLEDEHDAGHGRDGALVASVAELRREPLPLRRAS